MNTSEGGLEALIVRHLTGSQPGVLIPAGATGEAPIAYAGGGYVEGKSSDYDRDHAVDLAKLLDFLQRHAARRRRSARSSRNDGPKRASSCTGSKGRSPSAASSTCCATASSTAAPRRPLLPAARPSRTQIGDGALRRPTCSASRASFATRRTRAAYRSTCALFVNGLPGLHLRAQEHPDQADRRATPSSSTSGTATPASFCSSSAAASPTSPSTIRRSTSARTSTGRPRGSCPFNKGYSDGAGNPPNPNGIKTDYLWLDVLQPGGPLGHHRELRPGRGAEETRRRAAGNGRRSSPATTSSTWCANCSRTPPQAVAGQALPHPALGRIGQEQLDRVVAHQLVGRCQGGRRDGEEVFDSVIVVTDRRVLDKQLRTTIKQFAQVGSIVGAVTEGSAQLRQFIEQGKKIIISTVQKFSLHPGRDRGRPPRPLVRRPDR